MAAKQNATLLLTSSFGMCENDGIVVEEQRCVLGILYYAIPSQRERNALQIASMPSSILGAAVVFPE